MTGSNTDEFFKVPPEPVTVELFESRLGCRIGNRARRIHIGQHPVRKIRLVDLASGKLLPKSAIRVDASANSTEVEVATLGGPLLVSYVAVAGPRPDPEMIGVTATYELTADEIVARLRAFEAGESRRLEHYTSMATLSYHYTAGALNETIDVTSENRFYWKDQVGEYEELVCEVEMADAGVLVDVDSPQSLTALERLG